MEKKMMNLRLVDKREWPRSVFMRFCSDVDELPAMRPGQFAQVRVDHSDVYLRRPISIHYVDYVKRELWMLIQKVGTGTHALASLPVQSLVNMILPLGNGYSLPEEGTASRPLLIGGGIGLAPLLFLGEELSKQGHKPSFLLGGRSQEDLIQLSEFEQYGPVLTTTEDGSMGVKGRVTDHPVLKEDLPDRIYCCGPLPMMKAVAKYAREHQIWCEVSLENKMACGIGACLCCVENTKSGHVCVCQEGPVFQTDKLSW